MNNTLYSLMKRMRVKVFGYIRLKPKGPSRGNVLLSYITYAFVRPLNSPETHTNFWECRQIAQIFLDLGYCVDVIDEKNHSFVPKKKYIYAVDIHANLERLAPLLGKDCIKVWHGTGAHWLFQNPAEYSRLIDIQKRKGVALLPRRLQSPMHSIEAADVITLLGNDFTESTYTYAQKKIYRIPLSTSHTFPSPEKKDIPRAKKGFVWFGAAGLAHKGLDLVLEAFADMPEYHLSVCGSVSSEKDFETLYHKELYETANIKTYGKVDPGGDIFKNIADSSIANILPSCSEGSSGSVVVGMHAGLIPIVSYESGIDIEDFGVMLKKNTIEEIKTAVKKIAETSDNELRKKVALTWTYANKHHTRAAFTEAYRAFLKNYEM